MMTSPTQLVLNVSQKVPAMSEINEATEGNFIGRRRSFIKAIRFTNWEDPEIIAWVAEHAGSRINPAHYNPMEGDWIYVDAGLSSPHISYISDEEFRDVYMSIPEGTLLYEASSTPGSRRRSGQDKSFWSR